MLRSWKKPKSIDVEEEEKIYIYENYKGGFFALLLFFFFCAASIAVGNHPQMNALHKSVHAYWHSEALWKCY